MSKRIASVVVLAMLLAGCGTIKGWFQSDKADEKKALEPAELVDFTPSLTVTKLWSENVGKGEDRLGLRQGPVVAGGRVYAAAVEGGVRALDLQTGQALWRYAPDKKEELRFSGGPGAGEGLVVVGSLDGDVIALDAESGAEKWRAEVTSEVIAAPTVGQGTVLVRSNDGRVTAFDAASGERKWFNVQELPTLTLRGNAPVTLGPGVVFVGNDDGTLAVLALNDGRPMWDQVVGTQEGRSELARMADVDGAPVLDGNMLFATSAKNSTVALDGASGRPVWSRDNGGPGGLAVSSGAVFVTDPDSTVWALDKYSGGSQWSHPQLARRSVTAPALQGDYVVVGDFDGYLHWLKQSDGELAARERVGRKALRAQPVVSEGILLVQNVDGALTALRLGQ